MVAAQPGHVCLIPVAYGSSTVWSCVLDPSSTNSVCDPVLSFTVWCCILQSLPSLVLKIMQVAAAIKPIPPHFSQGLRDIISSMLKRNPEERPNIENIMATPIMVNVLVNLGTDVGRLPCTRYDNSQQ